MTQNDKPTESKEENKKPQDNTGVMMTGHIKIFDPETGEVIVDKMAEQVWSQQVL